MPYFAKVTFKDSGITHMTPLMTETLADTAQSSDGLLHSNRQSARRGTRTVIFEFPNRPDAQQFQDELRGLTREGFLPEALTTTLSKGPPDGFTQWKDVIKT